MKRMRLLLDQMVDEDIAVELRRCGHDVIRVCEVGMSTADDDQILEKAKHENRILITLDEHFGDWVVLPLSRHAGVIRVKAVPTTSGNILMRLLPFLTEYSHRKFANYLVILKESGVRWVLTSGEH